MEKTSFAQVSTENLYSTIKNLNSEKKVDSAASIIRSLRNSDPMKGIELGSEILASVYGTDTIKSTARFYDEMGVSFRKLGEFNLALKFHFDALRLYKANNDKLGEAFTLHNIGNVYRLLNQYDISLEHLTKSLKLKREFDDKYQISFSLNTIGLVWEEKGNIDSSEIYMQEALALTLQRDTESIDSMNLANIYSNLANIEIKAEKFEDAEKYLFTALDIYEEGIADYGIAQAFARLANVYIKTKKYNKALDNLNKGFEIVKLIQAKDLEKDFYLLFSEYYKNIGNYKKEAESLINFIKIKDVLSNQNGIRQITEVEFNYQLDEKEKENQLLKQRNEIAELNYTKQNIILISSIIIIVLIVLFLLISLLRNRKIRTINHELLLQEQALKELNNELSDLNATQNKLFSIIAHDLRNPFNFLILSTSLMLEEYGQIKEEDKIQMLNSIETVSKESYILLSNLLEWANLQTGRLKANKVEFKISESLNKNIKLLEKLAAHKKIKIIDHIEDSVKVFTDKDMLDTIFRNVITNAIKFSNEEGSITIKAEENASDITICVNDDGVGMEQDIMSNLFKIGSSQKRNGTANERGSGLGLLLCKELVEENGGKIWVESNLNSGTSIYFTLDRSKNIN